MSSEFLDAMAILGSAALAGIVWLLRLEGKVVMQDKLNELRFQNANLRTGQVEKDLAEIKMKHEALNEKIAAELSNIKESLATIAAQLRVDLKLNRGDSNV